MPRAFELQQDLSSADWIVESVKPWGKDRVRMWSFLPDVFDAYARVLHPAFRGAGNAGTVRWAELAHRNGVTLGPATRFREVSGIDPTDDRAWDEASPNDGNLEQQQIATLAEHLAPFTTAAELCWLAAWEGWGSWGPGSSAALTTSDGPHRRLRRLGRRSLMRHVEDQKRKLEVIPRLRTEHRAYFLFRARLRDISSFQVGGRQQAPNMWWPDDRAWCVSTEVDGYSTYVGGTLECVDALISSTAIEAIAVPSDVPMDPGPY